ncbi:MAG: hypothetical protein IH852_10575 [Bacteroidetes bacterium]|nr:hypothetical protein [Bacteroidota bacterium]
MRVAFNLRIPAQSKLLTFAALDARAGVEWVTSVSLQIFVQMRQPGASNPLHQLAFRLGDPDEIAKAAAAVAAQGKAK